MPVMTISGAIPPENIGITLPHEHILINLANQAAVSPCSGTKPRPQEKVEAKHLPLLLKNPYIMPDNLRLDNLDDAVDELNIFKNAGGNTVVDCTPPDIGRDPEQLHVISKATGINIVMGCGYYTQDTHPPELKDRHCENIRDELLNDLLEGTGSSKLKAGIIGEIGTSKDIHPDEFKVLKGATMASVETGAAIQVHTYPWSENGIMIADFLLKNNVNPKKIVICHTDVALNESYMLKILERGVFLQFDNFGKEFKPDISSGSFAGGSFARDIERARIIKTLLDKGFENQILITTDICLKCLLRKHGGKGYSHILENIVEMLKKEGIPGNTTKDVLMKKNPAAMLDK